MAGRAGAANRRQGVSVENRVVGLPSPSDSRGGIAFSEPIRSRLAPGRQGFELGDGLAPSLLSLSRRELEVLRRLACGEAVRGIAGELNRSIRTINNHRTNLMKKLGIHNRVALARFAVESGLVGLEMRFPRGVG